MQNLRRDEFGCKVIIATTLDEGFVVGMRNFPGNLYDGHTLKEALEQLAILTEQRPDFTIVACGLSVEATRVPISGTLRGWTPKLTADLRRQSAIKVDIGHLKPTAAFRDARQRAPLASGTRRPEGTLPQHPKDPNPPLRLAWPDSWSVLNPRNPA